MARDCPFLGRCFLRKVLFEAPQLQPLRSLVNEHAPDRVFLDLNQYSSIISLSKVLGTYRLSINTKFIEIPRDCPLYIELDTADD
jgi:hypothetical protein